MPGRVAVTVVPDNDNRAYSLMFESVELDEEEPRKCMAVLLFVTALIDAVPVDAVLAIVTVPYWTLLIRFVVSPSTMQPVMTIVPAVPVLRVAVIVVELVSAR